MENSKYLSKLDKIFFWSDPHFGHKNVLRFCPNRQYETIEEMNEDFIKRYNSVVPSDGICIWVGDCFFVGKVKAKAIMDQLNGMKILVRGNHDEKHSSMYNVGFDFVMDYMELIIAGEMVKVNHFPGKYSGNKLLNWIKFKSPKWLKIYKPRYFDRYPEPDGRWLIHGHTHTTVKIDVARKFIHVGVDAHDGTPVSYRTIERIIQKGGL